MAQVPTAVVETCQVDDRHMAMMAGLDLLQHRRQEIDEGLATVNQRGAVLG